MNGIFVELHFLTGYFFSSKAKYLCSLKPNSHLIYSVKKKNSIIMYDLIDINLHFLSAIKETEVFIKVFMFQSYRET